MQIMQKSRCLNGRKPINDDTRYWPNVNDCVELAHVKGQRRSALDEKDTLARMIVYSTDEH